MFQIMNNDFLMILYRSSLPLLVLQKPFSSGKRLSNNQVRTLTQHTCTSGMWFFSKYADFSGLGKLIKYSLQRSVQTHNEMISSFFFFCHSHSWYMVHLFDMCIFYFFSTCNMLEAMYVHQISFQNYP